MKYSEECGDLWRGTRFFGYNSQLKQPLLRSRRSGGQIMVPNRDSEPWIGVEWRYGSAGLLGIKQPLVLILAAKWWPLSARLAAVLLRQGCGLAAVCPFGHPLRHVTGIEKYFIYAGLNSLESVRRAVNSWQPDIVVPCDDGVVQQLHAMHESDPPLRPLIERSLGPPESYGFVRSRQELLTLAKSLGVRVPETRRVNDPADLTTWHREVSTTSVLKVDGESGGNGVAICRSLAESLAARRRLGRRCSRMAAWKRLIIDRNPLSIWARRLAEEPQISVQEFVPGRPANSMMVCREGEVLALLSVIVVAAESAVGAAVIVRVVRDERMAFAAKRLASHLRLCGFFGLDFMIDGANAPILIELNPRCTQLGHFELPEQSSLAAIFAASCKGEPAPPPARPIHQETIALFPQALAAGDPCKPYVEAAYLDLPTCQPRLTRELQLPSWPQRQWLSVLYHRFVRVRRPEAVMFESPMPAPEFRRHALECEARMRARMS